MSLVDSLAASVLVIGFFALQWGYFLLFELLRDGQTPGKKVLRLRVLHSSGQPVSVRGSVIRNVLRIVDFQPAVTGVLGGGVMMLTGRSQRLGDLAADTIVVRDDGAGEIAWPEAARTPAAGLPSSRPSVRAAEATIAAAAEELSREARRTGPAVVAGDPAGHRGTRAPRDDAARRVPGAAARRGRAPPGGDGRGVGTAGGRPGAGAATGVDEIRRTSAGVSQGRAEAASRRRAPDLRTPVPRDDRGPGARTHLRSSHVGAPQPGTLGGSRPQSPLPGDRRVHRLGALVDCVGLPEGGKDTPPAHPARGSPALRPHGDFVRARAIGSGAGPLHDLVGHAGAGGVHAGRRHRRRIRRHPGHPHAAGLDEPHHQQRAGCPAGLRGRRAGGIADGAAARLQRRAPGDGSGTLRERGAAGGHSRLRLPARLHGAHGHLPGGRRRVVARLRGPDAGPPHAPGRAAGAKPGSALRTAGVVRNAGGADVVEGSIRLRDPAREFAYWLRDAVLWRSTSRWAKEEGARRSDCGRDAEPAQRAPAPSPL